MTSHVMFSVFLDTLYRYNTEVYILIRFELDKNGDDCCIKLVVSLVITFEHNSDQEGRKCFI